MITDRLDDKKFCYRLIITKKQIQLNLFKIKIQDLTAFLFCGFFASCRKKEPIWEHARYGGYYPNVNPNGKREFVPRD